MLNMKRLIMVALMLAAIAACNPIHVARAFMGGSIIADDRALDVKLYTHRPVEQCWGPGQFISARWCRTKDVLIDQVFDSVKENSFLSIKEGKWQVIKDGKSVRSGTYGLEDNEYVFIENGKVVATTNSLGLGHYGDLRMVLTVRTFAQDPCQFAPKPEWCDGQRQR